jgi:hypothetical protein
MEYRKIKDLKGKIESILCDNSEARNSDITLTIALWRRHFPGSIKFLDIGLMSDGGMEVGEYILIKDLYWLPREDNVKRARAKLQEEARERIQTGRTRGNEHYFFPTIEKIAKQRGINQDEWRVAMSYPTRETAGTPKPSWIPPSEQSKEPEQDTLL